MRASAVKPRFWIQGLKRRRGDWYGLLIIIDHGHSYHSVYAHASRLLVSKGDKVKRGQDIAAAGNDSDALSDREGIYFEIRYNGQPVDPLAWLSSSRG